MEREFSVTIYRQNVEEITITKLKKIRQCSRLSLSEKTFVVGLLQYCTKSPFFPFRATKILLLAKIFSNVSIKYLFTLFIIH